MQSSYFGSKAREGLAEVTFGLRQELAHAAHSITQLRESSRKARHRLRKPDVIGFLRSHRAVPGVEHSQQIWFALMGIVIYFEPDAQ
jgi:hypothetical protein